MMTDAERERETTTTVCYLQSTGLLMHYPVSISQVMNAPAKFFGMDDDSSNTTLEGWMADGKRLIKLASREKRHFACVGYFHMMGKKSNITCFSISFDDMDPHLFSAYFCTTFKYIANLSSDCEKSFAWHE